MLKYTVKIAEIEEDDGYSPYEDDLDLVSKKAAWGWWKDEVKPIVSIFIIILNL